MARYPQHGVNLTAKNGVAKERLMLLAVFLFCCRPCISGADPPKREKYKVMIERLANRNGEPTITRTGKPLFPRSYDWEEASRVRTLYLELLKSDSEALWEELVKHVSDDRYSLTFARDSGEATNCSVGLLCRRLACERLEDAFYDLLPTGDEGRPVVPDIEIWDDLAAWRKQRKNKSLYELQINACQLAVEKLMREPALSAAERDEVRKRIRSRIASLKALKTPVFRKPTSFEYGWYDAEQARRIREDVQHERHIGNEAPERER